MTRAMLSPSVAFQVSALTRESDISFLERLGFDDAAAALRIKALQILADEKSALAFRAEASL